MSLRVHIVPDCEAEREFPPNPAPLVESCRRIAVTPACGTR